MTEGGAERVASLLVNTWAAAGHHVTLIPTFSMRGACFYPLDQRVQLEYLADRVGTSRKTVWSSVRRFLTLRRMVKEVSPEVVVSFLTHVNVVALLATAGMRIPVVVSERVYPPLQVIAPIWLKLCRVLYRRAALVVAQTEQTAGWIRRECARAPVSVIPNPIVLPVAGSGRNVSPTSVATGRRVLLSIGRLVEQKGYARLVMAFARSAQALTEWDLVILGDGPELGTLERLRDELGLGARVHLPGRVANVGEWYASADAFVLSSFYEGFPNALLEAMAHGLPCVSVDCPSGPADIIHHGMDGLLVADDEDGLARGIETLMSDARLREALGRRARDVVARFSLETVSRRWLEAFHEQVSRVRSK